MLLLNWIGGFKWRRARDAQWAERARLLYPLRISAQLNLLFLSGVAVLLAFSYPETRGLWPLFVAAGLLGGVLGCYPLDRAIIPEYTLRTWAAQVALGWGTRVFVLAPFFLTIALTSSSWDSQTIAILIAFSLWHAWVITGGLLRVWQTLGIVRPIQERAFKMVEPAFRQFGLIPRRCLRFTSPLLLAYAIPFRKTLLFSDGLLQKGTPEELQAITHHELAHLTEDRGILARRFLASCALLPFAFVRPVMGNWGSPGFALLYVVFFLLAFSARTVGRKAELRADSAAASHDHDGAYARALLKLYQSNQMPAVMPGKRQVHPHLYDRLVAVGVTPDFERPKPPAYGNFTVIISLGLLVLLGAWLQLQTL